MKWTRHTLSCRSYLFLVHIHKILAPFLRFSWMYSSACLIVTQYFYAPRTARISAALIPSGKYLVCSFVRVILLTNQIRRRLNWVSTIFQSFDIIFEGGSMSNNYQKRTPERYSRVRTESTRLSTAVEWYRREEKILRWRGTTRRNIVEEVVQVMKMMWVFHLT